MLLTTLLCVVFLFCCLNLVGTPIAIIGVILSVVCAMSWYIYLSISAFYSFFLFIVIAGGVLVVLSYWTALAPNPLLSSGGGCFAVLVGLLSFYIYVGLNEGIYLSLSLPVEMAPEFAIGFGMVLVFLGVMNLLWGLLRFILLCLYKFLSLVLKGGFIVCLSLLITHVMIWAFEYILEHRSEELSSLANASSLSISVLWSMKDFLSDSSFCGFSLGVMCWAVSNLLWRFWWVHHLFMNLISGWVLWCVGHSRSVDVDLHWIIEVLIGVSYSIGWWSIVIVSYGGSKMFGAWHKSGLCFVCLMELCGFNAFFKLLANIIDFIFNPEPEKLFRQLISNLGISSLAEDYHLWEVFFYLWYFLIFFVWVGFVLNSWVVITGNSSDVLTHRLNLLGVFFFSMVLPFLFFLYILLRSS